MYLSNSYGTEKNNYAPLRTNQRLNTSSNHAMAHCFSLTFWKAVLLLSHSLISVRRLAQLPLGSECHDGPTFHVVFIAAYSASTFLNAFRHREKVAGSLLPYWFCEDSRSKIKTSASHQETITNALIKNSWKLTLSPTKVGQKGRKIDKNRLFNF